MYLEICPVTLFGNMLLKLWDICTDRVKNKKQKTLYIPSPACKKTDLKFEKGKLLRYPKEVKIIKQKTITRHIKTAPFCSKSIQRPVHF